MNHVDKAGSERDKLPKKGYYTKEEAIEKAFEVLKEKKLYEPRRIRVWKHRWRNGKLAEKTIDMILEDGSFKKAMTLYRKVELK